jgi:very-short-patch-repair endonuclease
MAYAKWLHERADEMRTCPTFSEARAQESLETGGEKFLSQVVFGDYMLDFVLPERLLVLEIDGSSHATRTEKDIVRDAYCNRHGLRVLRIPNSEARKAHEHIQQYASVKDWEKTWRRASKKTHRNPCFVIKPFVPKQNIKRNARYLRRQAEAEANCTGVSGLNAPPKVKVIGTGLDSPF